MSCLRAGGASLPGPKSSSSRVLCTDSRLAQTDDRARCRRQEYFFWGNLTLISLLHSLSFLLRSEQTREITLQHTKCYMYIKLPK